MAWGNEWNKPIEAKLTDEEVKQFKQALEQTIIWPSEDKILPSGLNTAVRNNKIPTHDPYTNPGAFLCYQCDCGEVLEPKVKSFASLNNHASNANWKIRWGVAHYVPYCPRCVVEKGIE